MIVAENKPFHDILGLIEDAKKILIVGCGGCVAVCLSGGEKEVGVLASALRMSRKKEGNPLETVEVTLPRQCDPEYMDMLKGYVKEDIDCILSLGCGVGVQFIAERFSKWVIPAQNTKFAGGTIAHGIWEERCGLCGECILYKTGGICPIIRCSKSLLNGPCGGSQNGKCEVDKNLDCGWQLIYDRMKKFGKLDLLLKIEPPKDWSKSRDGGPRKVVREDVKIS